MPSFASFALLPALAHLVAAEFGLAGQLFQLSGAASVNNAKLAWATVSGASSYRVDQATGGGGYTAVGTIAGNTYDVYGLAMGSDYNFRVTALNGNSQVDQSSITTLTPFAPGGSYNTHDNTQVSDTRLKSTLLADNVYYRYNYETNSNGSFSRFVEQTSSNGYDFTGDKTVLDGVTLCAVANYSCKLERVKFRKNPTTGEFVMWAHFEKSQDYALGYVAVAHTKPGAASMTFEGAYRPGGADSRDMAFFADGNDAYLVTSTDTNTNMNIYALTANWTAVDSFLVQVNKGGFREAPAVVKSDNYYYIFTSRASGWLPSQPQYIAAKSMAGPWSAPANVGNTATFGTQSGEVNRLASGQFAMNSDRWSNNWPTKGGPTRQLMLPVSFSSGGGFAAYHFYQTVSYSDDITTAGQGVFGVQSGKIVSVGKPASSNAGDTNIALANDGIQTDPAGLFIPSGVPFTYTIDLQQAYSIAQVDLSTKMVQGSETYCKYQIQGSTDGQTFTVVVDNTNSIDVGFSAAFPPATPKYRYIRIDVSDVVNDVNNHAAAWAVGLNEVTVYGN
jgi:hypothetical protein